MLSHKPRLIAIDLDGTLLNSTRQISSQTFQAIQLAVSHGIEIILASGRMFRNLEQFQVQLNIQNSPSIASNGAEVRGYNGKVLFQALLPKSVKGEILSIAENEKIHLNAYTHEELWFLKDDSWGDKYLSRVSPSQRVLVNADQVMNADIVKCLLIDEPEVIRKFIKKYQHILVELDSKITESEPEYLEFLPSTTSKGTGLVSICNAYSIPIQHTIAIGDYLNDLEILQYSGFSVAVANAHPDILAIAELVTASNDDNGVALFIQNICERFN